MCRVSIEFIETRVKVWENEKCSCSCFYNSIGTRRTCFLFLLENTATKKKKNNLFTSIITAHASSVFLSSYRNTVLNQSACVFALGYFLKLDTMHA